MTNSSNPSLGPKCNNTITIDLPNRMEPPIYFYYKLENFYQNHRRYANSRDDYQLLGNKRIYSDIQSNCYPVVTYALSQDNGNSSSIVYNPCGTF
jgi:hypothetical protein